MGKRVSNKRGSWGARSNRIRIGWKRQRKIDELRSAQKKLSLETVTDEVKILTKRVGKALRMLIPKRRVQPKIHRHQGR